MAKPKYDVFLSHVTPDKPVVEALARLLEREGLTPWFDNESLPVGVPWQEALEKALEDSASCAVCLGPTGLGPWQNEEMRIAKDRQVSDRDRPFPVIPVLLPGAEVGDWSQLPSLLRRNNGVVFRKTLDDEEALRRLISGIRGNPPGSEPGDPFAEGVCPYRGLQVFDVGDARFFFGREELTSQLLDELGTDRNQLSFLAIVGPSGSGKSSLARAGLLASLRNGRLPESDAWPFSICKPGAEPLQSLALAFGKAFGREPSQVLGLTHDFTTSSHALHVATELALADAPAGHRLVVLVDQFEEVFTLCSDEGQRRALIDNLLYAATVTGGQTVIVLTLRADFYGSCAAYPALAAALPNQALIGPMTREELRSAIERPALGAGYELDRGLSTLLLKDVEQQSGYLPLLEHALLQLWELREGRRLTVAAYHAIGGVTGALEQQAESVYEGFTEEEKEICRRVFLRLVQVYEEGRGTKRRLRLDELTPPTEPDAVAVEAVVNRLTDARLLTTDGQQDPSIEVAHEALLVYWERLAQWIQEDREALLVRRRLDEAVREWEREGQDPNFLLKGGRLVQVEEWARSRSTEVRPKARELLGASIAARDQERQRQKRRTTIAYVIAGIAIVAAFTVIYLWRTGEQQRRIARAGEIADRSRTTGSSNPQLGLLLALQSLKMAEKAGEPYLPSAQSALRWGLSRIGGTPLPSGPVHAMVMTSNRKIIVTLGADRHLRRWNLESETVQFPMRDLGEVPTGSWSDLVASPDGHWLLISNGEDSQLLDLRSSAAKLPKSLLLRKEISVGRSETFSPDGTWLATRTDGYLRLRDLRSPVLKPAPQLSRQRVGALDFSPDGRTLATLSMSGLLERWSLASLSPDEQPAQLEGIQQQIMFSLDSKFLLHPRPFLVGGDLEKQGKTSRWIRQLHSCTFPDRIIRDQAGRFLACVSWAETHVWKAGSEIGAPVINWPIRAQAIDMSVDGHWFSLGDSEGKVYLQKNSNSDGKDEKMELSTAQAAPIYTLAFSQPIWWLVIHGGAEAPRVWDLRASMGTVAPEPRFLRAGGRLVPQPTALGEILQRNQESGQLQLYRQDGSSVSAVFPRSSNVSSLVAVSADGKWFAAISNNNELLVWRLESGGRVKLLIIPSTRLGFDEIQVSSHGHWLAARDSTGAIWLWNLSHPQAPPLSLTPSQYVMKMAFSPLEDRLATVNINSELHIYTFGQAAVRVSDSLVLTDAGSASLAFSQDGMWLAVGDRGDQLRIWQIGGEEVFLENRSGSVSALAFSPDGQWLVSAGGKDGTIQLWRWAGRNTAATPIILTGHLKPVYSVVFTPQGLASASSDSTVRLWELETSKLMAAACRSAGRTLSKKEWSTYLPSETYQPNEPCPGLPKAPD